MLFNIVINYDSSEMIEKGFLIEDSLDVIYAPVVQNLWFVNLIFFFGITGIFLASTKPVILILSLETMYIGVILSCVENFDVMLWNPKILVIGYILLMFAAIDSILVVWLFIKSSSVAKIDLS